jgi:hypothetical protein
MGVSFFSNVFGRDLMDAQRVLYPQRLIRALARRKASPVNQFSKKSNNALSHRIFSAKLIG